MNAADPSLALSAPSWVAPAATLLASVLPTSVLVLLLARRAPLRRTIRLAAGFVIAFALGLPLAIGFTWMEWSERDRAALENLTRNSYTATVFDGITSYRIPAESEPATPYVSRLRRYHFEVDWVAVLSTAALTGATAGLLAAVVPSGVAKGPVEPLPGVRV
jgi:hypothetical protein